MLTLGEDVDGLREEILGMQDNLGEGAGTEVERSGCGVSLRTLPVALWGLI